MAELIMCFKRNPSLGHYNANKETWLRAYRLARILIKCKIEIPCHYDGVWWKAGLIAEFDRFNIDVLTIPVENRLEVKRMFD